MTGKLYQFLLSFMTFDSPHEDNATANITYLSIITTVNALYNDGYNLK